MELQVGPEYSVHIGSQYKDYVLLYTTSDAQRRSLAFLITYYLIVAVK